ncbi:hypothetical protein BN2476_320245 [Paraburkholderia piptadeniae]|uniref:Uncharacterized protein n=1 Tax=Paraburkholderia piptadeniae TaxID=1701573 RepID=A0A1N7S5R3_9BURK|nr:hypothetical protein BN2476_320245 [Paraburkholderia piptadeniae]
MLLSGLQRFSYAADRRVAHGTRIHNPKINARTRSFNSGEFTRYYVLLPAGPNLRDWNLNPYSAVRVQSQSYTGTCYNSGFI